MRLIFLLLTVLLVWHVAEGSPRHKRDDASSSGAPPAASSAPSVDSSSPQGGGSSAQPSVDSSSFQPGASSGQPSGFSSSDAPGASGSTGAASGASGSAPVATESVPAGSQTPSGASGGASGATPSVSDATGGGASGASSAAPGGASSDSPLASQSGSEPVTGAANLHSIDSGKSAVPKSEKNTHEFDKHPNFQDPHFFPNKPIDPAGKVADPLHKKLQDLVQGISSDSIAINRNLYQDYDFLLLRLSELVLGTGKVWPKAKK